ncbi:MAG: trypsin-like peptidase domain-containing protein [Patescibacteria group bacterium]
MEISAKKILAITTVVSFLVSSIAGFIFGAAGRATAVKLFPQLAGQLIDKNESADNMKNSAGEGSAKDASIFLADNLPKEELGAVGAIKKANPAVVSIIVTKDLPKIKRYSPFSDPFFNQFFGQNYNVPEEDQGAQKQETGRGSGFIVSADGYIVTNKHVANDKKAEYTVLMNDGKEYSAKLLAADPVNDLAIIKIDEKNLPTVSLGDSDKLEVGQIAIAIGNSLGEFRNTASMGIISGLGRSITASGSGIGAEELRNIIQTDAAINPGNSGGPLLNLNGEVVGVNVAIAQGAQNIGFAIPINDAKKAINDVKTAGRIITPWLGVRYALITKELKDKNNLSADYGALILRGNTINDLAVIPGSPADKAGLAENDIILEINGVRINEANPLANAISKYSVGDELKMKILRKGIEKEIKVKLEERKSE